MMDFICYIPSYTYSMMGQRELSETILWTLLSNSPGSVNSGPLDDISLNRQGDNLTDNILFFARM